MILPASRQAVEVPTVAVHYSCAMSWIHLPNDPPRAPSQAWNDIPIVNENASAGTHAGDLKRHSTLGIRVSQIPTPSPASKFTIGQS